MNKMLKIIPALTVAAAIAIPTGQASADTSLKSKHLINANVKAQGTAIEVNANLLGGTLLNSSLLNNGKWEIVDQHGKTLFVKNTTALKLNAKIENLQPSVEYCLNVRVKGKVNEDLVDADVKLNADQKLRLTRDGLKIKNGLLCVTTGEETPDTNPKDPKNPKEPKNPVEPKEPKNPVEPKNPKEPVKPEPKPAPKPAPKPVTEETSNPSFFERLFSWF